MVEQEGPIPDLHAASGAGGARPRRRRDAEANRARILQAAAGAFAEEGLDTSLAEVARRAGVGNATLHRHFSSKDELLDELFEGWFARRRASAERWLTATDPWEGLVGFLEEAFVEACANRGLSELFALRLRSRSPLRRLLARILQRAQEDGSARPDATVQDVTLLLFGVGHTITLTAGVAPEQWRRHLAIVVAGLRAGGRPLPGQPIAAAALDRALEAGSVPCAPYGRPAATTRRTASPRGS